MYQMNKQEMRQRLLQKRRAVPSELLAVYSGQIEENVMAFIKEKKPETVMLYAAFNREAETQGIMKRLLERGICVGLPKCGSNGQMETYRIRSLSALCPGRFGILEPPEKELIRPEKLDMVFVPGCGFGRDGSRLGYGGGYYDRYLPKADRAVKIGLGYGFTVADSLPRENFDILMDVLITEQGVLDIM